MVYIKRILIQIQIILKAIDTKSLSKTSKKVDND